MAGGGQRCEGRNTAKSYIQHNHPTPFHSIPLTRETKIPRALLSRPPKPNPVSQTWTIRPFFIRKLQAFEGRKQQRCVWDHATNTSQNVSCRIVPTAPTLPQTLAQCRAEFSDNKDPNIGLTRTIADSAPAAEYVHYTTGPTLLNAPPDGNRKKINSTWFTRGQTASVVPCWAAIVLGRSAL